VSFPQSISELSVSSRSSLWTTLLPKSNLIGEVLEGVGIHTGKRFRVSLARNQGHKGLRFCALRADQIFDAPALWTRLSGTARATALVLRSFSDPSSRERFELKTIEHFLAAAHVMSLRGYDLCLEALDHLEPTEAFELPILDGSSARWLEWLEECVGERELSPEIIPVWRAVKAFEVRDGEKSVEILPHAEECDARTVISCSVRFPQVWNQSLDFVCDWLNTPQLREAFKSKIAPARTFGFERELMELERLGLARGGSLSNAILLRDNTLVNPEGFRIPQELAAHKLLDAIGDFALLGAPLLGVIRLHCAGHSMHLRAVAEAVRKGALVEGLLDRRGRFYQSS
jgi:UDP-3-O-[3-hydroxymyristoyl] N-acetylglucosamine deacetylase